MGMSVAYRKDVDGLRAIAVLPVVFFHANASLFSGGFVGVDIFFVISGFLITQIITAEMQAGSFSIVSFYERRIRRIFPALLTVLLLATLAAFLVMAPSELESYGKRLFATLFFVANFKFLKESDYFANESEINPLLHMWSLSVEEQFYLFFPILLLVLLRLKWRPVPVLGLLFLASFALSCWSIKGYPVETFFLLPTRAWELLLGSLLALNAIPKTDRAWLNEFLAWTGLGLIAGSVFGYTETTVFPGYGAVPPCLGAALLIYSGGGSRTTAVERLISLKPLVYIGLISYSLYLIHWPLIVYVNYLYPSDGAASLPILLMVALSFGLAAFSLKFIETPFRRKRLLKSRGAVFSVGALSVGAMSAFSLVLFVTSGLPARVGLDSDFYANVERTRGIAKEEYLWGECFFDTSRPYKDSDMSKCIKAPAQEPTLLMGDSHSAHLYPGIRSQWPELSVSFLSAGGCRPLLNIITKNETSCRSVHTYWFDQAVPSQHWEKIILAAQWKSEDFEELHATIAFLKSYANKIVLVGPSVEYHGLFPELYAVYGEGDLLNRKLKSDRFDLDAAMQKFAGDEGVYYVSMVQTICPNRSCTHVTPQGDFMHWDYGHLTLGGSQWVVQHWPKEVEHL